MDVLNNRILIRRITSVKAIKKQTGKRELLGYKAECNHDNGTVRIFTLSEWGGIAFELAEDWALNHKCKGDYNSAVVKTVRSYETVA